jgi:serine/threonine protein kinase
MGDARGRRHGRTTAGARPDVPTAPTRAALDRDVYVADPGSAVGELKVQPTRLGRYEVLRHLATGGMAEVLVARAGGIEGFERHVVIKRIRPEQSQDPRFVEMFLDEARIAAALHHQNLVQVHDIGRENGEYFFAMEYIHGEDLRRLLYTVSRRKQQVPFDHVAAIGAAAAAGLHHAHEQRGADRKPLQLVHRDVSPSNILIGYDGSVKVTDFGIAKAAMRSAETRSGTLKGKVSYMSPEQCMGMPVDRRSDVYALGVVLYELVTARRLFKAETDFLVMMSIVRGDVPPPSRYRPDLPPALEQVIVKAMSPRAADRFETAGDLRAALLAATTEHRSTSRTLADYMHELFGERPEPWHESAPPDPEIDVDFDGSASGAARVPDPEELLTNQPLAEVLQPVLETAHAPIAVARGQTGTHPPPVSAFAEATVADAPAAQELAAPVPLRDVPSRPVAPLDSAPFLEPASGVGPSTASAVLSLQRSTASRRRIWIAASIGLGVGILAIAILTAGSSSSPSATRPPDEAAEPVEPAAAAPPRIEPPELPPPQAATAPEEPAEVEPPAPAPRPPEPAVATKPERRRPAPAVPTKRAPSAKKPPPGKKSAPEWNSNTLFP